MGKIAHARYRQARKREICGKPKDFTVAENDRQRRKSSSLQKSFKVHELRCALRRTRHSGSAIEAARTAILVVLVCTTQSVSQGHLYDKQRASLVCRQQTLQYLPAPTVPCHRFFIVIPEAHRIISYHCKTHHATRTPRYPSHDSGNCDSCGHIGI